MADIPNCDKLLDAAIQARAVLVTVLADYEKWHEWGATGIDTTTAMHVIRRKVDLLTEAIEDHNGRHPQP